MTPDLETNSETLQLSRAMERYAQGDDLAFATLHRVMAPRLYAFFLGRTRNVAQAEDLVQQTFLQVHCARARYLAGTDIQPWFFCIARRLLIDVRRKSRPLTSLSNDAEGGSHTPSELVSLPCADERIYSRQLGTILDGKLQSLAKPHRLAFQLVKLDGLSHAEAAQEVGTTSAALKVRLHRICRSLVETPVACAAA